MIYDEENCEEDSRLLWKSIGGHGDDDINCLALSDHLSLIATGSSMGSVVVWDFETSWIDGVCVGHTKSVTGIQFIEPYPLMVTSSNDSTLCVWAVRGSKI